MPSRGDQNRNAHRKLERYCEYEMKRYRIIIILCILVLSVLGTCHGRSWSPASINDHLIPSATTVQTRPASMANTINPRVSATPRTVPHPTRKTWCA